MTYGARATRARTPYLRRFFAFTGLMLGETLRSLV
jgi:hypothetical protein